MRFIVLILALTSLNGFATKLKITHNDNPEVELDVIGMPVIENATGNIIVETESGSYNIVNGAELYDIGFYPSDYEVTESQTITVTGVVANATSCTASTVPSGAASWSGVKTPSSTGIIQQQNVSLTYAQLPATLFLICEGHDSKSFVISQQPQTSSSTPTINTFTAANNGSNTVTIQWQTTDVSSCTSSSSPSVSGWNGAINVDGSTSVTITQNTTFTLSCDSLTPRNVTVNYVTPGNPNCSASQIPPGLTAKSVVYSDISGHAFGTDVNSNWVENFSTSQYLTVSGITTSNTNWRRTLQFYQNPTNLNPNWFVSVSISECPGDFSASAVCNRVIYPPQEPVVLVSTHPTDNPNNYCIIEPNKTYYLNFVHDENPWDGTPGRCGFQSDTTCGIFFNEYVRN